jgi:glycosyltransferase involved in cell wall biosynthesis
MNRRVIGHMVVRNEVDRRLFETVYRMLRYVDELVVYDDQSDDGTYEWLARFDTAGQVTVRRRSDLEPSFLDDESAFRQTAWNFMEATTKPTTADWILCLDADETLCHSDDPFSLSDTLSPWLRSDVDKQNGAVSFHVAEIYDLVPSDAIYIRVDGFWGQIEACRYVRWRPNGRFAARRQGGGSVPAGWADNAITATEPTIFHYGYCTEEDRHTKYERYHGTTGHNPHHIESILTSPVLRRLYL